MRLKTALASGALPENTDSPDYDVVYDTFGELCEVLLEDWANPSTPQVRRDVAALVAVWETIPFNGVLVGVAANQPGVVAVAVDAARRMKLATVSKVLKDMQAHVPKSVVEMEDAESRLEWYQSSSGRGSAEALEKIEERINEGDFAEQLLLGVFQGVLAEPAEFFEAR